MRRIFWTVCAIFLFSWNLWAKVVDRIVAQVNDDIITLSDINRELAAVRQQLANQYSGDRLEQEIKMAEKGALDALIQEKLLLQKANEIGCNANVDVQVSATLERIRKENNIKDMQEFERILVQQGQSMAGFRDSFKKQITIRCLIDNFVSSRITLLSADIERYYNDHAQEFTSAEEVSLSEIVIPIVGEVSEAETRAKEIHRRLTQGESFATLASQYSKGLTASKGGSIGSYLTEKLQADIAKAIANVKEGEVTQVLRTKEGFVIYRVDTRKPATRQPVEEVKPEIQKRLWDQKFNPELEKFVSQLKEDAYIQIYTEIK